MIDSNDINTSWPAVVTKLNRDLKKKLCLYRVGLEVRTF